MIAKISGDGEVLAHTVSVEWLWELCLKYDFFFFQVFAFAPAGKCL